MVALQPTTTQCKMQALSKHHIYPYFFYTTKENVLIKTFQHFNVLHKTTHYTHSHAFYSTKEENILAKIFSNCEHFTQKILLCPTFLCRKKYVCLMSNMTISQNFNISHMKTSMLSGSPVITVWSVLRLQMEKMTFRYGG
jgi:hypothetical protein